MATIRAATEERVFAADKWFGLNQAGDGDTNLRMGEAADMSNFRVTLDGKLKKRPGMKSLKNFTGEKCDNIWHGFINGNEITVVSSDTHLYVLESGLSSIASTMNIGGRVTQFLGYANKLYMFCADNKYRVYDGTNLSEVEGYAPVILTNTAPAGSGTELQQINKLTKKRRVWFSPNGTATIFKLPETNVTLDSVKNRVTGTDMTYDSFNGTTGTLTFDTAPADGKNTVEVTYSAAEDDRSAVEHMRYAEIYNGTTDARVFIYGDGTNRALYSGLDYDGNQRADYFPDMNVIEFGDENTPITHMIRHYSRLIAFKTGSAYSVYYNLLTTEDGTMIPGFYTSTVNRTIGNEAPGQVQLIENNPVTLFQESFYRWSNHSSRSANLTADERNAVRISDKVWRTLKGLDLTSAYCFDNNDTKEWYCIIGDLAIVYAYGLGDVWYLYDNFPIKCLVTVGGELYGLRKKVDDLGEGTDFVHISDLYRNDLGEPIRAHWESGNMAFKADYRRKYSAMMWVGVVPLASSELTVTVRTDRKTNFANKVVMHGRATFAHADFAHWSFKTQRAPHVYRIKLKAKKFTYYKLIFDNNSDVTTAEINSTDVRVRYTGYVR